jgi:hypothetical protein
MQVRAQGMSWAIRTSQYTSHWTRRRPHKTLHHPPEAFKVNRLGSAGTAFGTFMASAVKRMWKTVDMVLVWLAASGKALFV